MSVPERQLHAALGIGGAAQAEQAAAEEQVGAGAEAPAAAPVFDMRRNSLSDSQHAVSAGELRADQAVLLVDAEIVGAVGMLDQHAAAPRWDSRRRGCSPSSPGYSRFSRCACLHKRAATSRRRTRGVMA